MARLARHPVVDIGAEAQQPAARVVLYPHFYGHEGRIIDPDADFLDRRDQKMLAVLTLKDSGEQPHQRRAANWRSQIEPRTITGDSHVEVAAKRRVPQMHRR